MTPHYSRLDFFVLNEIIEDLLCVFGFVAIRAFSSNYLTSFDCGRFAVIRDISAPFLDIVHWGMSPFHCNKTEQDFFSLSCESIDSVRVLRPVLFFKSEQMATIN
jgi:hypothetical protein